MVSAIRQFFNKYIKPADNGSSGSPPHRALQIATAALLIEVMRADGTSLEDEEQQIAETVQSRFCLTKKETDELLHMAEKEVWESTGFFEFTSLLNRWFDYTQKVQVIENLWEIALADKKLDKYEEHTVRKVADLLYVAHKDFIDAKLRIKKIMSSGKKP